MSVLKNHCFNNRCQYKTHLKSNLYISKSFYLQTTMFDKTKWYLKWLLVMSVCRDINVVA